MHGNNTSTALVGPQPVVPPAQRQQQEDSAPYPSQPAPTVDELSSASSSSSPTSTSPTVMPAPTTPRCQYPGCSKSAKYGPRNVPPIACQAHKRAGQFTLNRRGELLKATRDGDAFRTPAVVPTVVPPSSPANSETAGTAATAAQRQQSSTGGSGSSGGSSATPSHRKTSAKPSPTPVHTLESASRSGLSGLSSGDDGSPGSQSSLCLFPGCDVRSVYGLPGAVRAVYCFSHKKSAMVRVSEDAPDMPNHEGRKTSVAPAAAESKKKALSPTNATDRLRAKKARRAPKVDEEGVRCAGGRGGEQRVKNDGGGKAAVEGSVKATAVGGSRSKVESSPSPPAATTPTTTEDEEAEEETAATMQPPPPPPPPPPSTNRFSDTSGMSPADEFLVLKQAREAAKKEAEARGGGRRPRTPSRRSLEASGRMKGEGAQWMTQEKKDEQARVKKQLREQRRQYRAAGLGVGVVVEAYMATGTAAATGTGDGVVGGGGSGGGGAGGVDPVCDESGWQKVSPALLTALPPPPREKGKVAPVAGERPGKRAGSTEVANSA